MINNLDEGGAQKIVLNLASCENIDATVITFKNKKNFLLSNFEKFNIKVFCFKNVNQYKKIICALINTQILHIHLFPDLYLFAFLPKKKIYTEHNSWNKRRKFKLLKFLEAIIYKNYDEIICISNPVKRELTKWIGLENKIQVIDNGLTLSNFTRSKRISFPISSRKIINLGMSGRFVLQKDQFTLIRSLVKLPNNVCVVLFGDGPLKNKLEKLVHELSLHKRVIFKGWVNDIDKALDIIDLYVQSSNWEGFGLSPLEAMAKGVPTIASDVPGLNEVIGSKRYLFEKNNVNQLIKKIKYLLYNDKNYLAASDFSIKRSRNFSDANMINNYLERYVNIIES